MEAALYNRYGGAVRIGTLPAPTPGKGQVLVRIRAAALNPKDVILQSGRLPLFRLLAGSRFPRGIGYDWSGEAVAIGPNVRGIEVGDALFGMMNGWAGGTCATHAVVSRAELAGKPASLSFEEAAAIPLAAQTALQALRDDGRLREGQRVLINGASGGVGTFAVQIAKAMGARVTATTSARNLALVRSLGADDVIDYATWDPRHTETHDVFFDVFGNRSFGFAKAMLGPRGVFVSTVPKGHVFLAIATSPRRARLVRVRSRTRDLEALAAWAERGHLKPVIDHVFPLSEMAAAEARVASKRAQGKVVITP